MVAQSSTQTPATTRLSRCVCAYVWPCSIKTAYGSYYYVRVHGFALHVVCVFLRTQFEQRERQHLAKESAYCDTKQLTFDLLYLQNTYTIAMDRVAALFSFRD